MGLCKDDGAGFVKVPSNTPYAQTFEVEIAPGLIAYYSSW